MAAINLTDLLASGQARRVSDTAVEIVTPGYHSSQGDSMSIRCSDPRCPTCNPSTAMSFSGMAMPSGYSPLYNNVSQSIEEAYRLALKDLFESGPAKQNKEPSMTTTSKMQRVIEDLRGLDEKELPSISLEIENIKSKNKARIADSLNGVVDLAVMGKAKLHRFVVAYFVNDEAKTAEGVEFGDTSYISEDKVTDETRVWVSGSDYPVKGTHYTMARLRKRLDDAGISYKIKYLDK